MESVQSVERAAAILESLARGGRWGRRLVDVAAETGLRKSTAHRILNTLAVARLVEQDSSSGHFFLGFGLFALGASAANRYGLLELANGSMLRLAERSEDTVFLSVRSGTEAVCVDRVSGSYPIKTLTIKVGDRRPLGVGAGSLALLAWLPDEEVHRIVEACREEFAQYGGIDATTLPGLVRESRERGYAFVDRLLVPGMCSIGAPVRGRNGRPVAALSIAAIESRMGEQRRAAVAGWLVEEAAALQEKLGAAVDDGLTEATLRRLASGAS